MSDFDKLLRAINDLEAQLNQSCLRFASLGLAILPINARIKPAMVTAERDDAGTVRFVAGFVPAGGGPGFSIAIDDPAKAVEALRPFLQAQSERQQTRAVNAVSFLATAIAIRGAQVRIGQPLMVEAQSAQRFTVEQAQQKLWSIQKAYSSLAHDLPAHWIEVATFATDALRADPMFPVEEYARRCALNDPRFAPELHQYSATVLANTLGCLQRLQTFVPELQQHRTVLCDSSVLESMDRVRMG